MPQCATTGGGKGSRRERERKKRHRQARKKDGRGEKETRYILYDSVIAFPRTNIAPAERTQENVDVNRRPLLPSTSLSLSLPLDSSPLQSHVLYRLEISLGKDVCKMLPTSFLLLRCSIASFSRESTLFDSPNPAKSPSSRF